MLFSPMDSERFSLRIGKTAISGLEAARGLMHAAKEEQIELMIARCPVDEVAAIHQLETNGFELMDTLIYLARSVSAVEIQTHGEKVRQAVAADADAVEGVARSSFANYVGHYHADSRLPRDAADRIYPDWARRCVLVPSVADCVLVYEHHSVVAGFAALKLLSADCCDGMLFSVAPDYQKKGIFRALLQASCSWAAKQGVKEMEYSTQLRNIPALRGVMESGFLIKKAAHTFHCWTGNKQ
ncbi:GNAT family N-acetyltransferase [Paracidovorax konjaci]|uniref:Acetyltransferase (GNAT) family protein n=1 Tax=Paracidovorax konjaci TaxID=32040 RepID=A0A1I1RJ11_9BURK|nr:GNAT family N-acetyltransferase [Paracidovorax konjaci]SFD32268.1 Acetyltransferase (GNAT) family protein [Paracidovorax konjaci]